METTHLGQTSALPASPSEASLDYVPNPRAGELYLVRFAVSEFTSLCPVTGQPDFAHLVIDYAPGATIVESNGPVDPRTAHALERIRWYMARPHRVRNIDRKALGAD